jgi:ABC-type transport system involved in multi-copper enzyme maturation permease subunit
VSRPARAPRPSLLARRLGLPSGWLPGPPLDFNPVLWREWQRRRPARWLRLVWLAYGLLAAFFTLFTLAVSFRGPRGPLSAWVGGLLVAIGLLLLVVDAATSLAEERARGTLDLLLATPLPTSAIVLGKWLGSYRAVLWLAVLPLLLAAGAVEEVRGWLAVLLLAAVVVVYGASVNGLGLALATWFRRPALALAVVVYVLVTVGWFLLAVLLFRPVPDGEGIACLSPFVAAAGMTAVAHRSGSLGYFWVYLGWAAFWLAVHLALAVLLLALTLLTFNRCVGRVGVRARPRAVRPRPAAVASAAARA